MLYARVQEAWPGALMQCRDKHSDKDGKTGAHSTRMAVALTLLSRWIVAQAPGDLPSSVAPAHVPQAIDIAQAPPERDLGFHLLSASFKLALGLGSDIEEILKIYSPPQPQTGCVEQCSVPSLRQPTLHT